MQGHAAPVLYAAWAEVGYVKESDLLNLRKIDSDLEGHPTPVSLFICFLLKKIFLNKNHMNSLYLMHPFPLPPETRICRRGYRLSRTGSGGGLRNGVHWQKLRQIQVCFCFVFFFPSQKCIDKLNPNFELISALIPDIIL